MHPIVVWYLAVVVPVPPSLGLPAAELAQGALCGLDDYEDNGKRPKAKSVESGGVDAVVCSSDTDWFWFEGVPGRRVEISIEADAARGVDVSLFPPRARKSRGRVLGSVQRRFIRYRMRRPGKHRIRIRTRATKPIRYRLAVRPL